MTWICHSFAGCQGCGTSLAPYNAFPFKTGFIRCRNCVGDLGFQTVAEFESSNSDSMNDHEAMLAIQQLLDDTVWKSCTLEHVAEILIRAGYRVRDRHEIDGEE